MFKNLVFEFFSIKYHSSINLCNLRVCKMFYCLLISCLIKIYVLKFKKSWRIDLKTIRGLPSFPMHKQCLTKCLIKMFCYHHNDIFCSSEKKISPKTKDSSAKKKKPAEELVDRVFRKTGGGFGVSFQSKEREATLVFFVSVSSFCYKYIKKYFYHIVVFFKTLQCLKVYIPIMFISRCRWARNWKQMRWQLCLKLSLALL